MGRLSQSSAWSSCSLLKILALHLPYGIRQALHAVVGAFQLQVIRNGIPIHDVIGSLLARRRVRHQRLIAQRHDSAFFAVDDGPRGALCR
jgi:hypothetical protein